MDDIALEPRGFVPERGAGRGVGRGIVRVLRGPPLHAWRARRRIIVAGVVALAAWLLAVATGAIADSDGRPAARIALADARHRLADARRQVATLPALRQAASGRSGHPVLHPSIPLAASRNPQRIDTTTTDPSTGQIASPLPRPSAGPRGIDHADRATADVRDLSQLAAATGVVLMSLEPGAENRGDAQAARVVKLTAQTDFAHLNAFLRQLQTLPALVVPAEITVKRHGDSLSMTAMLRIFDGLRAPAPDTMLATQPERQTQQAQQERRRQSSGADSSEDSFQRLVAQPMQPTRRTPQAQPALQIQARAQQVQQARQARRMPQAPPAQQIQQTRRTRDHERLIDPFGSPPGNAPDSSALRLTGVIADRANAVALVETPQGTQTVSRGSALGSERVIRVGIPEIVLSHGDATHTLTWEEKPDAQ